MAKTVAFVSFLFLIAGCAMPESSDMEAMKQALSPPASDQETQLVVSEAAEPVTDGAAQANRNLSREEARRVQVHLKGAGFYRGPIDGIVGPKTTSAIRQFQSRCITLDDLLGTSDAGVLRQAAETQSPATATPAHEIPSLKETRLMQVRLKNGGFDPGPIDGKHGPKTRTAILRLRSGCTMIKHFPAIMDKGLQTAEKRGSPAFASVKKSAPVVSSSPGAEESFRNEASKPHKTANKAPSQVEIRQIQLRLKDAGLDPGPIDGMMGPKTRSALLKFQTSHGLARSETQSSGSRLIEY